MLKVDKILEDPLIGDEWMISRRFIRNGKDVWVKGFGKTKELAFIDYEYQHEDADSYVERTLKESFDLIIIKIKTLLYQWKIL